MCIYLRLQYESKVELQVKLSTPYETDSEWNTSKKKKTLLWLQSQTANFM